MSLLDKGNQTVVVYQEIATTDDDGNQVWKAGPTGVSSVAVVQPLTQSGTSQRRAEQDNEGYETEEMYRLRLPRSFPFILGSQAEVEWLGKRWQVIGMVRRFNGSIRTKHVDYMIRRT